MRTLNDWPHARTTHALPRRAPLAALALAAASLAAGIGTAALTASPADARDGKTSPLLYDRAFDVDIKAESTAKYHVPRFFGHINCYNRHWYEADANQKVVIRTKKRTKIGAITASPGTVLFVRLDGDLQSAGVPAGGSITRSSVSLSGSDPGECGGGAPTVSNTGSDCGLLTLDFDVALSVIAGRLSINPQTPREPSAARRTFKDCLLVEAKGSTDGGWDKVEGRLTANKLMNTKKTVKVQGATTWREDGIFATEGFAETTTKWTVSFKPRGKARR